MGGGLEGTKYDWGGSAKKKCMGGGGVREKIKCVGGRPRFFPVRLPLRISNGIALSCRAVQAQILVFINYMQDHFHVGIYYIFLG